MKQIFIIKTGDSIQSLVARRGDFEDWIIARLGSQHLSRCTVVAVHRGELLPDYDAVGGIIITGSHAMVTDQSDWSEKTAEWLLEAIKREIPILGICFGHQLLAYALGGKVDYMPGGYEFGTISVSLTSEGEKDPLLRGLPRPVEVYVSHYQAVLKLPPKSTLLAFSEKDPHSAFRYGSCTWGVQFHPEYNAEIANAYITEFNKNVGKSPNYTGELPRNRTEISTGGMILKQFAEFADGS